jgi:hypothetical protein
MIITSIAILYMEALHARPPLDSSNLNHNHRLPVKAEVSRKWIVLETPPD